jgi:P27 family predicted phage terminase small subunit
MSGPPPVPTKLKQLRGNPGHQKVNKREPQPKPCIPTRPEWMLPEAKREWNRIVPELAALGLISVLDRGAVAGGCQMWAMYVQAVKDIADNGTTFTITSVKKTAKSTVTTAGYEGPRPAVAMMMKSWQQYLAFCARFGLTPADRSRLSVPEKQDDVSDFLERMSAEYDDLEPPTGDQGD